MFGLTLSRFNDSALNVARWSAVVMCFSLAISRSLFIMATAGLIFGTLASGQWMSKLRRLAERPAAIWFTLLLVWMFATSAWSEGNSDTIAYAASVQWKLLIIPFMVMVIDSAKLLERCWKAFGMGLAVLLAHVVALQMVTLPWVSSQSPSEVFFNPLPQSVALALFCSWCLYAGITRNVSQLKKALIWSGFLIGTYAVFYLSIQRLGYLSWFAGCGIVLFLTLPARARWWALAALIIATASIISTSGVVRERINEAYDDVSTYKFENDYSSVGSRLHMWYVSARTIGESPIVGHGLGSYPVLAEAAFKDPAMCDIGCKHPHNQYVFYAVEFGLLGLGLFIAALIFTLRDLVGSWRENVYPLTVLIIFVICGLVESTLWYRGFFYLFVTLLGGVAAGTHVYAHRLRH